MPSRHPARTLTSTGDKFRFPHICQQELISRELLVSTVVFCVSFGFPLSLCHFSQLTGSTVYEDVEAILTRRKGSGRRNSQGSLIHNILRAFKPLLRLLILDSHTFSASRPQALTTLVRLTMVSSFVFSSSGALLLLGTLPGAAAEYKVDFHDAIIESSRSLARDMMTFYHGEEPGKTPGKQLPDTILTPSRNTLIADSDCCRYSPRPSACWRLLLVQRCKLLRYVPRLLASDRRRHLPGRHYQSVALPGWPK